MHVKDLTRKLTTSFNRTVFVEGQEAAVHTHKAKGKRRVSAPLTSTGHTNKPDYSLPPPAYSPPRPDSLCSTGSAGGGSGARPLSDLITFDDDIPVQHVHIVPATAPPQSARKPGPPVAPYVRRVSESSCPVLPTPSQPAEAEAVRSASVDRPVPKPRPRPAGSLEPVRLTAAQASTGRDREGTALERLVEGEGSAQAADRPVPKPRPRPALDGVFGSVDRDARRATGEDDPLRRKTSAPAALMATHTAPPMATTTDPFGIPPFRARATPTPQAATASPNKATSLEVVPRAHKASKGLGHTLRRSKSMPQLLLPPSTRPLPCELYVVAEALYDFKAVRCTDLSFSRGDKITVIRQRADPDSWWEGIKGNRRGEFPANYVRVIFS